MESEEFETMHELVGAFVLGALSQADYDAFTTHLARCESCQQEIDELQGGVDALGAIDELEPLSQDLLDRLLVVPDQVVPSDPAVDSRPSPPSRSRAGLFALAAALVLIVGGFAFLGRTTSPVAELAAASDLTTLSLLNDTAPAATLTESAELGRIGFIDQDFVPLQGEEEIYVLWKLVDGGQEFVGFVRDPDQQDVDQTWDVELDDAKGFAVSIETVTTAPPGPSERIIYVGTSR